MTKEEAKEILAKSEELEPWTHEGITWYYQIDDDLFYEHCDSFGFVVYAYSEKQPLDKNRAFQFYVYKDDGIVVSATAPMDEKDFARLGRK